MRWFALGVDYEMAGKDLIELVKLSSKICRALGGTPPEGFNYELFLDDKGQKISKSKGNGLTIEEWLTYASPESLSLFMYQKPTAAKRLYFDVIPRAVDDYLSFLDAYPRQAVKERLGNPVWHVHSGEPPPPEILRQEPWRRNHLRHAFEPGGGGEQRRSTACFGDFCAAMRRTPRPTTIRASIASSAMPCAISAISCARPKNYRAPDEIEREALGNLEDMLAALPLGRQRRRDSDRALRCRAENAALSGYEGQGRDAERPGVSNDLFNMLYDVLLGESRGPRFGSFVALYGDRRDPQTHRRRAERRSLAQTCEFRAQS